MRIIVQILLEFYLYAVIFRINLGFLLISCLKGLSLYEATLDTTFEEIFPVITSPNVKSSPVITSLNVKLVSYVGYFGM